jgi:hypothetical protein
MDKAENMNPFDNATPWMKPEHDALVNRLQHLEWTEVRTDLRERCWDDFMSKLAAGPKSVDGPGTRPVADARAAAGRLAPLRIAAARR